ncbi:MAG: hypothetical protein QHI38_10215 [Armatimonadota bacterium]|nr:hypothetical protein [Armatimonadota bacterium]
MARSRGGDVEQTVLCRECANDWSRVLAGHQLDLGNLFEAVGETKGADHTAGACKVCGVVLTDIIETGRLGCPNCYDQFGTAVIGLITDLQGRTCHVGKTLL